MILKTACCILLFITILVACYYLQPVKKGIRPNAPIKYELVKNWPRLPAGFKLGNPSGIGIGRSGHIIVFHRAGRKWPVLGPMPKDPIKSKTVLIIDQNSGALINSWGNNFFIMPHGLTVDKDNNIWVTDVGLHQVFKFSYEGKLLMQLGVAGVSGNDSVHFNKPTDVAIAADGSLYVSDGYGNNRVVKFSASGKYEFQWGKKGKGEGEFNLPHGLCLDGRGHIFVADRENNRIQEFDLLGTFVRQWKDDTFGAMCAVFIDKTNATLFAIDDFTFLKIKHRGSDIFVFDTAGRLQTRFGRSGAYKGPVAWYHDLVIDSHQNIYTGDILGNTLQKFRKVAYR